MKKSWKSFTFSFCVPYSNSIQKMKDVHENKRKVVFTLFLQRMEKRVREIYAKLLKFALGLRNLFHTLYGCVCVFVLHVSHGVNNECRLVTLTCCSSMNQLAPSTQLIQILHYIHAVPIEWDKKKYIYFILSCSEFWSMFQYGDFVNILKTTTSNHFQYNSP